MQKNIFLIFGDIFPFSNACAIQINLGTNYLLKTTVLEKMGYWQKESELGEKEGCFKAPLGSLGLKLDQNIYETKICKYAQGLPFFPKFWKCQSQCQQKPNYAPLDVS